MYTTKNRSHVTSTKYHRLFSRKNSDTPFWEYAEIQVEITQYMVGPQDGGFGFDGAPKYSNLEGKNTICVQCQAGQHSKCLAKNNQDSLCDCELCMIS